jgi:hypothetical protein
MEAHRDICLAKAAKVPQGRWGLKWNRKIGWSWPVCQGGELQHLSKGNSTYMCRVWQSSLGRLSIKSLLERGWKIQAEKVESDSENLEVHAKSFLFCCLFCFVFKRWSAMYSRQALNSLCGSGWPGTQDPPTWASQCWEPSQVGVNTPTSMLSHFNFDLKNGGCHWRPAGT